MIDQRRFGQPIGKKMMMLYPRLRFLSSTEARLAPCSTEIRTDAHGCRAACHLLRWYWLGDLLPRCTKRRAREAVVGCGPGSCDRLSEFR